MFSLLLYICVWVKLGESSGHMQHKHFKYAISSVQEILLVDLSDIAVHWCLCVISIWLLSVTNTDVILE